MDGYLPITINHVYRPYKHTNAHISTATFLCEMKCQNVYIVITNRYNDQIYVLSTVNNPSTGHVKYWTLTIAWIWILHSVYVFVCVLTKDYRLHAKHIFMSLTLSMRYQCDYRSDSCRPFNSTHRMPLHWVHASGECTCVCECGCIFTSRLLHIR